MSDSGDSIIDHNKANHPSSPNQEQFCSSLGSSDIGHWNLLK